MSDLAVPTIPLRVTLMLTSGATLEGDVFLPVQSPVREGPMLAEEWANLAPAFIPVRTAACGEVTFVARGHIVAMALPAGVSAAPTEEVADAPVHRVLIETVGGANIDGRVTVAMPRYQQRVNDWLNTPEAYLAAEVDGRAYLVQKSHIVRIGEIRED